MISSRLSKVLRNRRIEIGLQTHPWRTLIRTLSARQFASDHQVTLYQYRICPFCNKVKALLHYAGMEYKAVEVNPLTKAEIQW